MASRYRFLVFCAVGTVGFLVDLGVLYAVSPWLGWYGGRIASFLVAASVTWQLNRTVTFSAPAEGAGRAQNLWRQYMRYLTAMLLGAGVNYAVYATTLAFVDIPQVAVLGVALGSIAGMAINFFSAQRLLLRSNSR